MITPEDQLKSRVYNVTAMSFTPEELFAELSKHVPELRITYRPDSRQSIGTYSHILFWFNWPLIYIYMVFQQPHPADSWPQVLDDTAARADWNWQHKFDLHGLVDIMVREIKQQQGIC